MLPTEPFGCPGGALRGAPLRFQLLCAPRLACLLPRARGRFWGPPSCLSWDVLLGFSCKEATTCGRGGTRGGGSSSSGAKGGCRRQRGRAGELPPYLTNLLLVTSQHRAGGQEVITTGASHRAGSSGCGAPPWAQSPPLAAGSAAPQGEPRRGRGHGAAGELHGSLRGLRDGARPGEPPPKKQGQRGWEGARGGTGGWMVPLEGSVTAAACVVTGGTRVSIRLSVCPRRPRCPQGSDSTSCHRCQTSPSPPGADASPVGQRGDSGGQRGARGWSLACL